MTVDEFERDIWRIAVSSSICLIPQIRRSTVTTINLRIPLITDDFIDVFYNEVSGAIAFALIHRGSRIYGADNAGGWHYHPFHNPNDHIPLSAPMQFSTFLEAIEQHIEKL